MERSHHSLVLYAPLRPHVDRTRTTRRAFRTKWPFLLAPSQKTKKLKFHCPFRFKSRQSFPDSVTWYGLLARLLNATTSPTQPWLVSSEPGHGGRVASLQITTLGKRLPTSRADFCYLRNRKGPRQGASSEVARSKLSRDGGSTGSSRLVLGWHRNVSIPPTLGQKFSP